MMNGATDKRVETLEIKLMHQETAVEELTHTVLCLEKQLRNQEETIKRMEVQIRTITPPQAVASDEETPPPHY